MGESRAGRRIYATRNLEMRPYDLDGPLQPEMSYAPLSHDARSERGSCLMRCLLLGLDWDPPIET